MQYCFFSSHTILLHKMLGHFSETIYSPGFALRLWNLWGSFFIYKIGIFMRIN